jgi:hypothetical protein
MKNITDYKITPGAFNVRRDVIEKNIVRVDSSAGSELPPGLLPANGSLMQTPTIPNGVVPVPPGLSALGARTFALTAPASARKIYADVVKRKGVMR